MPTKYELVAAALDAGMPVEEARALYDPELHQRIMEQQAKEEGRKFTPEMKCRLYVIPAGEHVKVGISEDVESRWKALRSANPLLERAAFISNPLAKPRKVEQTIHSKLDRYRVVGTEWFKCGREIVLEIVHSVLGE